MKKTLFVLLVLLGVTGVVLFWNRNHDDVENRLFLEENEMKIEVVIHDQVLEGVLENTDSARAFYQMLPLSLTMNELNGNEKYRYLESMLPSNPIKVETIEAGDIMLYGDNCLVLFYEDFKTSYSYTRIGKIENVEELQEVIGTGSIEIEIIK